MRRRSSFAAEAAARHVPLKRQGFRQFTDTCRVAGLPADPETRYVGSALTRSDAPPLSFAAEAAARHVPLKRQGFRQFTDTCRVAGLPADSGRQGACLSVDVMRWSGLRRARLPQVEHEVMHVVDRRLL